MIETNNTYLNGFLKNIPRELYMGLNAEEKVFVSLLDKHGYVQSPTKFQPSFLKKMYDSGVRYFAFKMLNQQKYTIVLKDLKGIIKKQIN